MAEHRHTRLKRRTLMTTAWAVPVIAATSAVPAMASSWKTDLAIDVIDPPYDLEKWEPKQEIPVYRKSTGDRIAGRGSLPPRIRITNVGRVTAVNPSGTVEITIRDYISDYSPWGANRLKAVTTNPTVLWSEDGRGAASGPGARFTYKCAGQLGPGQSLEIPLRYFVNPPFVHVAFNVLVAAWVEDERDGDYDDNSLRIGHVPFTSVF
ncbi:hypothetical protein [Kocuria sp. TGY1127_2]|uniref:hypothetical protein n=1 Tax=Kocuria sp. TGY1127_2 TaxID=2711328 RepID=UPI0015BC2B35|nr:hypothetical protein [Kocuria sp. TGY1127_2]